MDIGIGHILIITAVILVGVVLAFVIVRNRKDRLRFEQDLNRQDEKPLEPPTDEKERV